MDSSLSIRTQKDSAVQITERERLGRETWLWKDSATPRLEVVFGTIGRQCSELLQGEVASSDLPCLFPLPGEGEPMHGSCSSLVSCHSLMRGFAFLVAHVWRYLPRRSRRSSCGIYCTFYCLHHDVTHCFVCAFLSVHSFCAFLCGYCRQEQETIAPTSLGRHVPRLRQIAVAARVSARVSRFPPGT